MSHIIYLLLFVYTCWYLNDVPLLHLQRVRSVLVPDAPPSVLERQELQTVLCPGWPLPLDVCKLKLLELGILLHAEVNFISILIWEKKRRNDIKCTISILPLTLNTMCWCWWSLGDNPPMRSWTPTTWVMDSYEVWRVTRGTTCLLLCTPRWHPAPPSPAPSGCRCPGSCGQRRGRWGSWRPPRAGCCRTPSTSTSERSAASGSGSRDHHLLKIIEDHLNITYQHHLYLHLQPSDGCTLNLPLFSVFRASNLIFKIDNKWPADNIVQSCVFPPKCPRFECPEPGSLVHKTDSLLNLLGSIRTAQNRFGNVLY